MSYSQSCTTREKNFFVGRLFRRKSVAQFVKLSYAHFEVKLSYVA